jgi:antitoxin YefM
MEEVKFAEFRAHLKDYIEKAVYDREDVCLKSTKGKNVILMSEERYNELMRAARFAGYLEMIRKNEELIKATMDDQ